MAALELAGISAVLNIVFMDMIADQIRRDVLLPNLLEVTDDINPACQWNAKFSGRTAGGAYLEGADMVDGDFDQHLRKSASLAWAEYRKGAKVTGLAQAIAAAQGRGGGQLGVATDVLYEEIKDAVDDLAKDISVHTYSGDVTSSPTQIEGLARAIDSTGTYAGLSRGTYTEWASAENSLAEADLSIANLREKLHRPVKDACGMYPEFVVVDGATFDLVGGLFGSERRYLTTVNTAARGAVELSKLAGGFRAIEVDGIPYIEDRHCTAGTLYALHSTAVSYRQMPAFASAMEIGTVRQAVKDLIGVTLEEDQIRSMLARGSKRLQPTIKMLGSAGDNEKAMVKVYAQLRNRYPNRTGKLTLV